jgi:hypothetical protein
LIYQIKELETNSKNRNIRDLYRGINEFNPLNTELNPICHLLALVGVHNILHVSRVKRGSVPGTNLLKDEEGDLMQIPAVF